MRSKNGEIEAHLMFLLSFSLHIVVFSIIFFKCYWAVVLFLDYCVLMLDIFFNLLA